MFDDLDHLLVKASQNVTLVEKPQISTDNKLLKCSSSSIFTVTDHIMDMNPQLYTKEIKIPKKEERTSEFWFHRHSKDLPVEIKRDFHVIQSRAALDRKHFYKKNDFKDTEKFQVN